LGRRGTELGQRGPQARARGEAAGLEASRAKRREVLGRLRRKKRGEGEGFPFLNSFQICFSNFQTSIKQKSMHSNHDAQTLIISKLF
jgi:hypothetical protein